MLFAYEYGAVFGLMAKYLTCLAIKVTGKRSDLNIYALHGYDCEWLSFAGPNAPDRIIDFLRSLGFYRHGAIFEKQIECMNAIYKHRANQRTR